MTSFCIIPRRRPSGVRRIGSLTFAGGALVKVTGAAFAGPAALASPTPHAGPMSPARASETRPKALTRFITCLPNSRARAHWRRILLLDEPGRSSMEPVNTSLPSSAPFLTTRSLEGPWKRAQNALPTTLEYTSRTNALRILPFLQRFALLVSGVIGCGGSGSGARPGASPQNFPPYAGQATTLFDDRIDANAV